MDEWMEDGNTSWNDFLLLKDHQPINLKRRPSKDRFLDFSWKKSFFDFWPLISLFRY